MNKEEALTLALEALKQIDEAMPFPVAKLAQKAIKEALAQPEPAQEEAVDLFEYWNAVEGWVKIEEVRKHFGSVGCGTIYKTAGDDRVPLYTSPPAGKPWVGLTQEDIDIAFDDTQEGGGFNQFARAIEAKLKEKNT